MKHTYYMTTWDGEKQDFTPQKGLRSGPYSLWGLKRALQKLKWFGYSADRDDHSILVLRDDFHLSRKERKQKEKEKA